MSGDVQEEISHEVRLVLAAAMGGVDDMKHLLAKPIDWHLVLQLAVQHQVYPLVYKTFAQFRNLAVPEDVVVALRSQYKANTLRALDMTGETIRAVDCLRRQGVPVVVLKGVALASHLYGDITLRPCSDVDILVLPNMIELTTSILESEGYRETRPDLGLTGRQREIYLRTYPHPHHREFWHNKSNILLEIHWNMGHLGQVVLSAPAPASIKTIMVAGSSVPVLEDEEWLLYLILHGASHAWSCFRWLVDVGKFMQRDVDWKRVDCLASSVGMRSILHHGLMLANDVLRVPLPLDYRSALNKSYRGAHLTSLAEKLCLSLCDSQVGKRNRHYNKSWLYIYNYKMRVGWRNKMNYVLSLWRPTIDDIKAISLPGPLYPLYYVIRPFTFFFGLFARSGNATVPRD